jgi:hypothetical protein
MRWNDARNAEILARYEAGASSRWLAGEYGLCKGRIHAIIHEARRIRAIPPLNLNDIDTWRLSARSYFALRGDGVRQFADLKKAMPHLRKIPNLGKVSWAEITAFYERHRE